MEKLAGAAQLDAGGIPSRDARARAPHDGIVTLSRSRASSLASIGRASQAHGARRARRRLLCLVRPPKTQAGGERDPRDEGSGSHSPGSEFGAIEPHMACCGVREERRARGDGRSAYQGIHRGRDLSTLPSIKALRQGSTTIARPIEPSAVLGCVRLREVRAGSACRVRPRRRSRCAEERARPSTEPSLVCAQGSVGTWA